MIKFWWYDLPKANNERDELKLQYGWKIEDHAIQLIPPGFGPEHQQGVLQKVTFKLCHRRIPPCMAERHRSYLEQLLAGGINRKPNGLFASEFNIVLVWKKSVTLSLCVDQPIYLYIYNRSILTLSADQLFFI